jgi:hypothetical protein
MLHQEIDHIASFPGTEALEDPFGRGYIERGVALGSKRAEPFIILPALLQLHKFTHNLFNAGGFKYSRYGLLGDQLLIYRSYKDNMGTMENRIVDKEIRDLRWHLKAKKRDAIS